LFIPELFSFIFLYFLLISFALFFAALRQLCHASLFTAKVLESSSMNVLQAVLQTCFCAMSAALLFSCNLPG